MNFATTEFTVYGSRTDRYGVVWRSMTVSNVQSFLGTQRRGHAIPFLGKLGAIRENFVEEGATLGDGWGPTPGKKKGMEAGSSMI